MSATPVCYRLLVKRRLSEAAAELVDMRYGASAVVTSDGTHTVVDLSGDQAALRALLSLLWDLGHEVLAVDGRAEDVQS